ncbi:helix-turn-helix domain-containing protein, partial [Escherichia coli]|nr:helix-turn-helix domain-containing protein [Escherichia coli]
PMTCPWPKGELIIATALETQPWVIWPSRYHDPVTQECWRPGGAVRL